MEAAPRVSPLAVLRQRDFAIYWAGQAISLTGTWMQQLAVSWAILELTSRAFALGALNFAGSLPPALLLLHGGVVADRFDRRRIILVTQVVAMLLAFTLAALVHRGALAMWHVFAAAITLGLAMAFDLPATQAFVAELVPREQIGAAVSLNQTIFHGSRLIGPALAGIVVARYGTFSAFLVNGLSFLPVILSLVVIRPHRVVERRQQGSSLQALKEGIAYVRERPQLAALLGVMATVIACAFSNSVVQLPFYVKHVLGLEAAALGTMMAVGGGSALLGSMLLLGIAPERRVARLKLGLFGMVAGLLLLAATPSWSHLLADRLPLWVPVLALPALSYFLVGLSISTTLGLVSIIIQQSVPDELRGRVSSLQGLVFLGTLPFASLIVTQLTDLLSMPVELCLAAVVAAIAATALSRRLDAGGLPVSSPPAPVAGSPAP